MASLECILISLTTNSKDSTKWEIISENLLYVKMQKEQQSKYSNTYSHKFSAMAYTDCRLLTLKRNDFLFIFGANTNVMTKVENLIDGRTKDSVKSMRK